jgi:hypothetical protein
LFVLTAMVGSVTVSALSGSPRVLLAREGWMTGAGGVWLICSAWTTKPLAYLYSRPLLESWVGPAHVSWDELYSRLPRFRQLWRVGTVSWGVGLVADAGARLVIAYRLPFDLVPAVNGAQYGVTTGVLILTTNMYYLTMGLYDQGSPLYLPLQRQDEPESPLPTTSSYLQTRRRSADSPPARSLDRQLA